jgi:hypothetical protein
MERHEIEYWRAHAIVCLNTVQVAVADHRGDLRFLWLSGPSVLDTLREIVALAPVAALYVSAPCAHGWTWRPEPVARKRSRRTAEIWWGWHDEVVDDGQGASATRGALAYASLQEAEDACAAWVAGRGTEGPAPARAAARRSACSICGDRIAAGGEGAHYARHERAAAGDEDARGGAPRP